MSHSAPFAWSPVGGPAAAAVLGVVLTRGPISRVGIARLTGLSSAAVTKAARPLIEAGYLVELPGVEHAASGVGRPASPLAVCADREFFAGVRISGDELVGVVTDLCAQIRNTARRPLGGHGVPVVEEVAALVGELLGASEEYRARTRRLGVSVSGDAGPVPEALLAGATGLDVTLENGVRALTVAEQWFGEGVGASPFALVTLGAEVGCGLVVDGRLVTGAYGVAGEIGHLPVADGGPRCRCGGRGCLAAYASREAITAACRAVTGRDVTPEAAAALARAGDEEVRAVFARAGRAVGLALAAVVNLVGPERIVVAGDEAAACDLLEHQIRETLAARAYGGASQCPLVLRPLRPEGWARGAAVVALRGLFPDGPIDGRWNGRRSSFPFFR
ncbi:ROK family transcriptional regulator [Microtetraspora fusca]|uniref:ROK family transcriptional regulator n=1 Tax=Microtetraspora fusca TaxID=1997 RepID=UPI000A00F8BC|nr:ROK family transcriptional regulator [Microtetraspora fusca]